MRRLIGILSASVILTLGVAFPAFAEGLVNVDADVHDVGVITVGDVSVL